MSVFRWRMMSMQPLTTERLNLRMITHDDSDFIQALYNTEDFLNDIGDKGIDSPKSAVSYIENNILKMYEDKGVCLLLVEDKHTLSALGVCGLIKRDTLEAYDIGYGYFPSVYGKGIAYEAAKAVLDDAQNRLKIKSLVAITTSNNQRSINLLERLGFSFERIEEALSESVNLDLYQLTFGRQFSTHSQSNLATQPNLVNKPKPVTQSQHFSQSKHVFQSKHGTQ